jgi:HD-GYP domain-containing protein (c-di-GMP phosphodiesterase class II)
MKIECSQSGLHELAETLSMSWSKLGAQIGWFQTDPACCHSVGPNVEVINPCEFQPTLAQCTHQSKQIPFVSTGGRKGLAVPIITFSRSIGSIYCLLPASLSAHADALLEIFDGQVSTLHNASQREVEITDLSENLTQSYEELNILYKLTDRLKVTEEPKAYFQRFAHTLMEIVQTRALVLIVRPPTGSADITFVAGEHVVPNDRLEAVARHLIQMAQTLHGPAIITDLSIHPALVGLLGHVDHQIVMVPLRSATKAIGVIAAIDKIDQSDFDSTDAKLLNSIAEQTSNFLQNRFLVQDLQELLVGLLTSLVSAIDAKDPYTSGHSQRVAFIGRRIAETLGLSPHEVTEVYLAGLLHDIGKIGVSDEILTRPGKLSREEFAIVRQHPVIGSRIISGIRQLRNILPGVLYHHERHDGSGYPEGLKGDEIPFMGSIVALSDCFDAITSDRTYRNAINFTQALEKVTQSADGMFSPILVQALAQCDLAALEEQLPKISTSRSAVSPLPSLTWLQEHY